ncbi:hypothetical protein BN1723_020217, partial [Verticillium longisporum]
MFSAGSAIIRAGARRAVPRIRHRQTLPGLVHGNQALSLAGVRALSTTEIQNKQATSDRTRAIIIRTLSQIGSRREGQQYLSYFTSVSSQKFAVIKVGGAILTDYLDELCENIA